MRKLRIFVVATLLALPISVASATPASACDRHPCYTRCEVNPPTVGQDPGGAPTIEENGQLFSCYY